MANTDYESPEIRVISLDTDSAVIATSGFYAPNYENGWNYDL